MSPTRRRTRRVLLTIFPEVEPLDLSGPLSAFSAANALRPGVPAPYRCEVVAEAAGPVATSAGMAVVADRGFAAVRGPLDTLLVTGGPGTGAAMNDPAFLRFLQRMAPQARRVASVCSGAFLLAEAGLLAGRRVTTHWRVAAGLANRHPDLTVDPDAIWIRDGRVYTSAGVTAGIDLALALIEEDLGTATAMEVARNLVVFLKRPGGQSQFSAGLRAQSQAGSRLDALPVWIEEHLHDDLSVAALARRVGMSPRHFARVFGEVFGMTPAKYVERTRVERARSCLEEGDQGIDEVAHVAGFENPERMRRTFLRHLHVVPQEYRRRFRSQLRESA